MFGHAARVASRPAAAAAAAAFTANAAQGSAHARAAPPQSSARAVAHPQVHSKIVDRDNEGWVLAELQDEVVLFQPFDSHEVDEAANTVMAMFSGGLHPAAATSTAVPLISEPGDEELDDARVSHCSSVSDGQGALADEIIEAAAAARSVDAVSTLRWKEQEQMQTLMAITTKMLRRPGMQREVVMCMMEDPEVRELMLRQCNDIDRYLVAAGIHPDPQLLPPPPQADADSAAENSSAASNASASASNEFGTSARPGGPNLMSRLVGAVAGALEKAGDALAALGGWLRRYVNAAFAPETAQGGVQGEAEAEADSEELRPNRSANQLLGGVMVLAVAVFCVAVIRRPLVLRALSRR